MKRKVLLFLMMIFSVMFLVACENTPSDSNGELNGNNNGQETEVEKTDEIPPAFSEAIDGQLSEIEHLKGDEIDFFQDVVVIDNETASEDIVLTIEKGEYDSDIPGTYQLTYKAVDEAGNEATVTRTVVVIDTLDVTFPAIIIGEEFLEYSFNDETAFEKTSAGAKFRSTADLVHIMDKDFFLQQIAEYEEDWNGVPRFPWGSLALVTTEGRVVHCRFTAGVQLEIDAEGNITYMIWDLVWFTHDSSGELFKGLDEEFLDELLPEGGYVVFAASDGKARIFLNKNLYWSKYKGGGGMTKDVQDVDITEVVVEIIEEYNVKIPLPDRLEAPTIEIEDNTVSWEAVENAKGYSLYIDGQKQENRLFTQLEINLDELIIATKSSYEIEIVAVSSDIFKWTNSNKSNLAKYKTTIPPEVAEFTIDLVENTISWDEVADVSTYDIYLEYARTSFLIATTAETTLNLTEFSVGHEGRNFYYVKGINEDNQEIALSNRVVYSVPLITQQLEVGEMTTEVAIVTAENYFTRRKATDLTSLEKYLYKITGVSQYLASGNPIEEKYSTIVILDAADKIKFVRNIVPTQTYTIEEGWFIESEYKTGEEQLVNLENYLVEGDTLLIGKNGLEIKYTYQQEQQRVEARNFLAYHIIINWDEFPSGEGWKYAATYLFLDSKTVILKFT